MYSHLDGICTQDRQVSGRLDHSAGVNSWAVELQSSGLNVNRLTVEMFIISRP